jgi:FHA domain-containing protein
MWKLTIEDNEGATRELDLVRDGYAIGRDGTCDVFLPERNVSRRHARLERDAEGRWWLIDLGAPYGVFLNGHRVVGRAALSPGDIAQVGDHWLGLVDDEPKAEGVRAGDASKRPLTPWDVRAEPDRLLVFGGPDDGSRLRLDAGPVLIGVGEGMTIRLPEGAAPEGVHALLRPLPQGRYEIVRRSKAIGLRVHLNLAERALLYDGDLVHFELPDQTELVAMRFLAAQRVRHSTTTSFAETDEGAGLTRGHRLDPATLPTLEAIQERLREVPSGFRLEGESVWPLPPSYRAPPVRFTDVTNEPAPPPTPAPVPAPDVTTKPTVAHDRTRRTPRWVTAAALLALVAGAWELGQRWGDPPPTSSAPVVTPVAAAPPAATPAETAAAGGGARAEENTAASPVDPPTEPPMPNRPSTSAARSPTPPRIGTATQRPASARPDVSPSERLRGLCRMYADRLARGEKSPDLMQVYRTRCL